MKRLKHLTIYPGMCIRGKTPVVPVCKSHSPRRHLSTSSWCCCVRDSAFAFSLQSFVTYYASSQNQFHVLGTPLLDVLGGPGTVAGLAVVLEHVCSGGCPSDLDCCSSSKGRCWDTQTTLVSVLPVSSKLTILKLAGLFLNAD